MAEQAAEAQAVEQPTRAAQLYGPRGDAVLEVEQSTEAGAHRTKPIYDRLDPEAGRRRFAHEAPGEDGRGEEA